MELVRGNPEEFAAKDADFHRGLAKTSHNPLLIVLLDSIRDLMQEVRLSVNRYPGHAERVMPTHWKILERVTAKDPDGAREAMQEHLEQARHIIQQAVLGQWNSE
jgi:DNA-binding FadR family transcriptional regulator